MYAQTPLYILQATYTASLNFLYMVKFFSSYTNLLKKWPFLQGLHRIIYFFFFYKLFRDTTSNFPHLPHLAVASKTPNRLTAWKNLYLANIWSTVWFFSTHIDSYAQFSTLKILTDCTYLVAGTIPKDLISKIPFLIIHRHFSCNDLKNEDMVFFTEKHTQNRNHRVL